MSAPVIVSVTPADQSTDIVLGMPITVVFDQAIDSTTINEATFALMGPGQTAVLDPFREILNDPTPDTGREYITGLLSFPDSNTFIFTPARPLRATVTYTCLLAGADSPLATSVVKNLGGESMATSFQWSFTTGTLNQSSPPVTSPIPIAVTRLDPAAIQVVPKPLTGNDLSQQIAIYFPAAIDTTSLDPSLSSSGASPDNNPFNDITVTVDPFLGDPLVTVPTGLQCAIAVSGSQLIINLGNWPPPAPPPPSIVPEPPPEWEEVYPPIDRYVPLF